MKKMKNLICFLVIAFVAFIASPMLAMAETVASASIEAPAAFDLQIYFASLVSVVTLVMLLTKFLKPMIGTSGFWTKALSWIISIAVACIGYFLQLGIFTGMEWYWMLIYGFSSGLIANSIVDLKVIQGIIALFTSKNQ